MHNYRRRCNSGPEQMMAAKEKSEEEIKFAKVGDIAELRFCEQGRPQNHPRLWGSSLNPNRHLPRRYHNYTTRAAYIYKTRMDHVACKEEEPVWAKRSARRPSAPGQFFRHCRQTRWICLRGATSCCLYSFTLRSGFTCTRQAIMLRPWAGMEGRDADLLDGPDRRPFQPLQCSGMVLSPPWYMIHGG